MRKPLDGKIAKEEPGKARRPHLSDPMRTHARNPERPPSWIWLRAGHAVEKPGRSWTGRRWGDSEEERRLVRRARDFRRARERLSDEALRDYDPVLAAAVDLYDSVDHPQRLATEAYILARLTNSAVARRTLLRPAVVRLYAKIFFRVRPKLKAPQWIVEHAVGSVIHMDSAGMTGPLWRLIGYRGGPFLLDELILYQRDPEAPWSPAEAPEHWERLAIRRAPMGMAVAALSLSLVATDPSRVAWLLKATLRAEKQKHTSARETPDDLSANVDAAVEWLTSALLTEDSE